MSLAHLRIPFTESDQLFLDGWNKLASEYDVSMSLDNISGLPPESNSAKWIVTISARDGTWQKRQVIKDDLALINYATGILDGISAFVGKRQVEETLYSLRITNRRSEGT